MKILTEIVIAIALLLVGFAAGYPVGKSVGFATGSEWALVQADILAREEGAFMPVYLDNGNFRVVIKQPRNFYKRAWQLAERQYDQTGNLSKIMKQPGHNELSAWSRGQSIGFVRLAGHMIQ